MRRLVLALLILAPLATAQDGQLVYGGDVKDERESSVQDREFVVTAENASHPQQIRMGVFGNGSVQYAIVDAETEGVVYSRSVRAPPEWMAIEPLALPEGSYRLVIRFADFVGSADASVLDLVAADGLPYPGSLAYVGDSAAADLTRVESVVFVVADPAHDHEIRWGGRGTGALAWSILDEATGLAVFERSETDPARSTTERWAPAKAGPHRIVLHYDAFTGEAEGQVLDLDVEPPSDPGPPAPTPTQAAPTAASTPMPSTPTTGAPAADPTLGLAAPRTEAPIELWLGVGSAAAVALVAGGFAVRAARRRALPAAPSAQPTSAPSAPAPGALFLGKYRIERELGAGASGRAWLARHEGLRRGIVVKELRAEQLMDDRAREAFVREAQVLAQLDHPNVVRVFDVEAAPRGAYIMLEHVDGGSLEDRLRGGPMAQAEASGVLRDLLAGLAHAHAKGVIHRDIKPANVLLTRDGRAKLADFGVARAPDLGATITSGVSTGTPLYMAPEQLRGERGDARTDLYAAGVLAYRLLTGRFYLDPVPRDEWELRDAVLTRAPAPAPQLGAEWNAWLAKALAKEPNARFQGADEMLSAIPRS